MRRYVETIGIERPEYAAFLAVAPHGGAVGACYAWTAGAGVEGEGPVMAYPDRAQALVGAAKALCASLDAADPLRKNPDVTGVARQRMEKIRRWAGEVAEKHRPVAQAVSLFAEGV